MNKPAIASLLALGIGIGANATQAAPHSGEFCMFDPNGAPVSDLSWGTVCDEQVTGTIDNATFSVASPQPFFSIPWTAHDGIIYGPGTHTVDTIQGGVYTFTVGANQVGGHILFDWSTDVDIDVINVWDVNCVLTATNEECTYTSTDVVASYPPGQPDGILGLPMIDGAFRGTFDGNGFSANFNFTALFPLPGAPTFTVPADINFTAPEQPTPAAISVDLGTVNDEAPIGTVMDYSTDGKALTDTTKTWILDDNGTNTITVNATQTVTVLAVDWRATNTLGVEAFQIQNVTVTIQDTTSPVITVPPVDVGPITIDTSYTGVCLGSLTAIDAVDPNPTIEWSIDGGLRWNPDTPGSNCSIDFSEGTTNVMWRVVDATGNTTSLTQTVTLDLPPEIVGIPCSIDLTTAGSRLLDGRFTMRDSNGGSVGAVDNTVTGDIDPSLLCDDVACANITSSAATLTTTQPFFQFLWTANPIRLFGPDTSGPVPLPKTYTFETCPFPRVSDGSGDWTAADGSTKCGSQSDPNELDMTVGPGQLGAHMLFDWASTIKIDVAVVWDVGCNEFDLTSTDPDGDLVIGTQMVDGAFIGFNAAFDVSNTTGPDLADGGYTSTIPVTRNPSGGKFPIPLLVDNTPPANTDPAAVRSCVGGCAEFSTTNLVSTIDGVGPYQFTQVVLPLTEATPFWSLYRKYDNTTMTWGPFVINSRNDVKTAASVAGACPPPGDGSYSRPTTGVLADKLAAGHDCLELTIEDNGLNDANMTIGVIDDPGGVAEVPAGVLPDPATDGGGCTIATTPAAPAKGGAWLLLAGLLGLLSWHRRRA